MGGSGVLLAVVAVGVGGMLSTIMPVAVGDGVGVSYVGVGDGVSVTVALGLGVGEGVAVGGVVGVQVAVGGGGTLMMGANPPLATRMTEAADQQLMPLYST